MKGVKIVLLLAGVVCQIAAAPQLITAALTGLGAFKGMASFATDTETMSKAFDLGGNVTRFATYMVKNASEAGTSVARLGLNQTTAFGDKALVGGIGVGKQAISFVESAAKHFPGGEAMFLIAPVANAGLDVAGKIGRLGLNVTAKGGDKILNAGNRIVQEKAELVNTGVQKVIGVGRKAVNTMDSVKNSVTGLTSGLTSALGSRLTSAASGLTSAITGSGSESGSSSRFSGRLTSFFG